MDGVIKSGSIDEEIRIQKEKQQLGDILWCSENLPFRAISNNMKARLVTFDFYNLLVR
jgi:hypothetical protein